MMGWVAFAAVIAVAEIGLGIIVGRLLSAGER